MPRRLRPIGHEDRLSVVDHLDELRNRLFVCVGVLAVVFGLCFWQSSRLLNILNEPLKHLSTTAKNHISGVTGDQVGERGHLLNAAGDFQQLAHSSTLSPSDRALISAASSQLESAAKALPSKSAGPVPVTLGPGEPFTVSLTVAFYFAILISIPLLLYELYAFVVPAFNPREKAVALPIMVVAPLLFLGGAVFTYFIVLPAAIRFLQGYNAAQFQALVQAKPLYSFEVLTMGGIGLAFRDAARTARLARRGVIDGKTLTKYWRYALVVIADHRRGDAGVGPGDDGFGSRPARRPAGRQHDRAQGGRLASRSPGGS